MLEFNTRTKVFFTLIIIFFYLFLRSIPLPGIELSQFNFYNNSTFVVFADIIAGASFTKYSVLALNIVPTILSILMIQVFSILYINVNESAHKIPSNILVERYSQLFMYVFIVTSIIASIIYLKQLDLEEVSLLRHISSLYLIHYICCILLLVIGSYFILLLIQLINVFGIGKGFSVIILCNLMLTLNNIISDFIYKLPIIFITIIIIQCVITTFIIYKLDYTWIQIPISQNVNTTAIFAQSNISTFQNYFIVSLSTLSIFPVIITDSLLFVAKSSVNSLYGLFFYTLCQIVCIVLIYVATNRLLKKTIRYVRHIHKNNIDFNLWMRTVDVHLLLSTQMSRYYFIELFYLVLIIIISKIIFLVVPFYTFTDILLEKQVIQLIYAYNNNFMLIYLICIRLFLFIISKSDINTNKIKSFYL